MNTQLKKEILLCRLCAKIIEGTQQKDLFHESNKTVLQQIKELAGLTLKDMPNQMLPRFFCDECKSELPRACEFRRKIIKTQKYFKSKEYKNKFKAQKKIVAEIDKANDLEKTQPAIDESKNEEDDNEAMEYDETLIKDENTCFTSESDNEEPITVAIARRSTTSLKKSSELNSNAFNKSSHTTESASQEFDAVFLPFKKDEKNYNELNRTSDDDSDKDALEDFTADESDDPDFETKFNAKKKYPKKPSTQSNNTTKMETPKDPRKNPLFCYLCKTTLKTSHAFKVHCRKLHKGEKIFKCDSCEETFLRIKSLIRHNRIHVGGKLFECRHPACDMSFNAPTTRIHHERAKHTKDWPFLCPICGKSFITTTRGKEHMTVHTKERPYKCELCKTAYLQRNNFKKHRRSELHKSNEKKYKESMGNVANENENPANEDKSTKHDAKDKESENIN